MAGLESLLSKRQPPPKKKHKKQQKVLPPHPLNSPMPTLPSASPQREVGAMTDGGPLRFALGKQEATAQ